MSLWTCPVHGLYGGDVFCPVCGGTGDYTVDEDGRCLSSQAALPPSGLSRQEASQAKPAAANASAEPVTYRGWDIRRGRWPEPDWMATHPNYDASWEGEEDGWVSNGLSATAATYEALCEEIDIIEEERGA